MSIRNGTEALPMNDVHRHAADSVERPANRSHMSAVFLIRHVSHPTHPVFTVPLPAHPLAELLWRRVRPSSVPVSDHHVFVRHCSACSSARRRRMNPSQRTSGQPHSCSRAVRIASSASTHHSSRTSRYPWRQLHSWMSGGDAPCSAIIPSNSTFRPSP